MNAESKNRRLLIVEDEPELLEILKDICSEKTQNIHTAANGVEALAVLQNHRIDAIVSDINMPVMGGLQLLANLRSRGFEIPFIFLTGHGDQNLRDQALRFGATDFLDKPFDEESLLKHVDLALDLGVALNELDIELEFYGQSETLPAAKVFLNEVPLGFLLILLNAVNPFV